MRFDEIDYALQDFFLGVDEQIRQLNDWWARFLDWAAQFGGPGAALAAAGNAFARQTLGSAFPLPPLAHEFYQGLVGENPRADEDSLLALSEYWAAEAASTGEVAQQAGDAVGNVQLVWHGDGAPVAFAQRANELATALNDLTQTQSSLARGVAEFATQVVQAKVAFRVQVILLAAELAAAVAMAVPTLGTSVAAFFGRRLGMPTAVRAALRPFLGRIGAVSFDDYLANLSRSALMPAAGRGVPAVAGRAGTRVPLAGLGRGGGPPVTVPLRAPAVPAGRTGLSGLLGRFRGAAGRAQAGAAGRRAAPGIQRALIQQAKQEGAGRQELARLQSPAMRRVIAREVADQLQERAGRGLPAGAARPRPAGAGRLTADEVDRGIAAARQAVDDGLTTWSSLRSALVGYGVHSAVKYGGGGWVGQEILTHRELNRLGIEGYRTNPAGALTAVVGAGLGGAPLAFGTHLPSMIALGHLGGGLGYLGSNAVESWLAGEDLIRNLRSGGASDLLSAILAGGVEGVWERYIGDASWREAGAASGDFWYGLRNPTPAGAELVAAIGDAGPTTPGWAVAAPDATAPPAKTTLGATLDGLRQAGAVDFDPGRQVFRATLPSGSRVDVRFAVDQGLGEGEWRAEPGRYELGRQGWRQVDPARVVLSGTVRADLAEAVHDTGRQLAQAMVALDADLPVGEHSAVQPTSGKIPGAGEIRPGTIVRPLPSTVPAGQSTVDLEPAPTAVAAALSELQSGGPPGDAPYLAVTGDPDGGGVMLAHYRDGGSIAFAVEAVVGEPGAAVVRPGEWLFDGEQWRQQSEAVIRVSGGGRELVDAGLRELYESRPGTDRPHRSHNLLDLARAQAHGPDPVSVPAAAPTGAAPEVSVVPHEHGVTLRYPDLSVYAQFKFPPGHPGDPQVTLPTLSAVDGEIWQLAPATITVPGIPAAEQTLGHPDIRAAVVVLRERLGGLGELSTEALRVLHAPASHPLANLLQRSGAYLLPDPVASAPVPGGAGRPGYLVRLPGATDFDTEAQAVVDQLAQHGYQVREVADDRPGPGPGLPGRLLGAYQPGGDGAVELRVLSPDGVVAWQEQPPAPALPAPAALAVVGESVTSPGALAEHRAAATALATAMAPVVAERLGVDPAQARRVIGEVAGSIRAVVDETDPGLRSRLVWPADGDRPSAEVMLPLDLTVAHLAAAMVHEAGHVLQGRPVGLSGSQVVDREVAAHLLEWRFYRWLRDQVGPDRLPSELAMVAEWSEQTAADVAHRAQGRRDDYVHDLVGLADAAPAEQHAHLGPAAGDEAPLPGPPGPELSGEELRAAVLTGAPIGPLPYQAELAEQLNQQFAQFGVDAIVNAADLGELLESRYRDLVATDGVPIRFGDQTPVWARLRLVLTEPRRVLSSVHPDEQIHGDLGQRHWSRTVVANRASFSQRGLTVPVGVKGKSWLSQEFSAAQLAEAGSAVVDNRGPATPTELVAAFEVSLHQPGPDRAPVASFSVSEQTAGRQETLLLGVPDSFYQGVGETTRRTGDLPPPGALPHRAVLELTGQPELLGEIEPILAGAGVTVTDGMRERLLAELWALSVSYSTPTTARRGHLIPVLSDDGELLAVLRHNLEPVREHARPVGEATDAFRLEQVGVVRHQAAGRADVGHGVEASASAAVVTGAVPVDATASVSADTTAIRVMSDKNRAFNQVHCWGDPADPTSEPGVWHRVRAFRVDAVPLGEATVPGAMVTVMREADALRYGLPVSTAAVAGGDLVRGAPVRNPGEQVPYPAQLLRDDGSGRGTGAGVGTVRGFRLAPPGVPGPAAAVDDAGIVLLDAIWNALDHTGLLPVSDYFAPAADVPDSAGTWLRSSISQLAGADQVKAELQLRNLWLLERQLTTASLQTRYDELAQGGIELTLLRLRPGLAKGLEELTVTVTLDQRVQEAEFLGHTFDRDVMALFVDMSGSGSVATGSQGASGEARVIAGGGGRSQTTASLAVTDYRLLGMLFDHSPFEDPERSGDRDRAQEAAVAVWRVPHTLRVRIEDDTGELVGDEQELPGHAEVSLPAGFAHSDKPVPVATHSRPELFELQTATVTGVNAVGLTASALDLLDRARAELPSRLPRRLRSRLPDSAVPVTGLRTAVRAMANPDVVAARLPELVSPTGIENDQLFEVGFGRGAGYGIRVRASLEATELLGTVDVATTAETAFALSATFASQTRSPGWYWGVRLPVLSGHYVGGRGYSDSVGQFTGRERIPVSLEQVRRFHFRTRVSYRVDVTAARNTLAAVPPPAAVEGWVTWVLAEPDALDAYGKGWLDLPVSEVVTSLQRWYVGDLLLKRAVAAQAVRRLFGEPAPAGDPPPQELLSHALEQYADSERRELPAGAGRAGTLAELGRLVVECPYSPPPDPAPLLPEYLLRSDRFGLGFSAIEFLDLTRVLVDREPVARERANLVLKALAERVVPGVLRGVSDHPATIGTVAGLGRGMDAVAPGGIRAWLDNLLDGTDGQLVAVAEVPFVHHRPALRRLARRAWLTDRLEVVAWARVLGEPALNGEQARGIQVGDYSYRAEVGSASRTRDLEFGAGGVAGGPGAEAGRGASTSVSADTQQITIRTQTNWTGVDTATIPIEVVFELRRYGVLWTRASGPILRKAIPLRDPDGRWARTRTATFEGELGLQLPKGLAAPPAEPAHRRPRWRDLHTLHDLPSRFGVDTVRAQPLREAAMEVLTQLLGHRAEELRNAVHKALSQNAVGANLHRAASPAGYPLLSGVALPSQPHVRVEAVVRLSVTLEQLRDLPAGFGLGIVHRYQSVGRDFAGRLRPFPLAFSMSTEDLPGPNALIGAFGFGDGSELGVESGSGRRMELTSAESGPVVELKLRYYPDFEVTSYTENVGQEPVELDSKRLPEPPGGHIYLRVYRRDLPELLRLLDQPARWDFLTALGFAGADFSAQQRDRLARLREDSAEVLGLDQVLDAAEADPQFVAEPGTAGARAVREALRRSVPHGGLVVLTADPLASTAQLAARVEAAMAELGERAVAIGSDPGRRPRAQAALEAAAAARAVAQRLAAAGRLLGRYADQVAAGAADPPAGRAVTQHEQAHQHWQRLAQQGRELVAAAAEAEQALPQATGDQADPADPAVRRLAHRPVLGLDMVDTAREIAAELRAEIVLKLAEPDGQESAYRIAPDGSWYRDDGEQGLTEALGSLVSDEPGDLLDRAVQRRLDLPALHERATRRGIPLALLVAEAHNHAAAVAARAGVDVDQVISEARQSPPGDPADPAERLLHEAAVRFARWGRARTGFVQALAGQSEREIAHTLNASPVGQPTEVAGIADRFGFGPEPGGLARFRILLAGAGRWREGVGITEPDADLLVKLAGELSARFGLFDPQQRRLLLEVDPEWLTTALNFRPAQLSLSESIQPPPDPDHHPAEARARLDESAWRVVERYYYGMPMDRAYRGEHSFQPAPWREVRGALAQWGVPYAAWVASQLPGSRFTGELATQDLAMEVADRNVPSPAQRRFLDAEARRTEWVPPDADGLFHAVSRALTDQARASLAAAVGAGSEAELAAALRSDLADALAAEIESGEAGDRTLRSLAPELRSRRQWLEAVAALRDRGAVGHPSYARLPELLAARHQLDITVIDEAGGQVRHSGPAPVALSLLRTGDHHMPVRPAERSSPSNPDDAAAGPNPSAGPAGWADAGAEPPHLDTAVRDYLLREVGQHRLAAASPVPYSEGVVWQVQWSGRNPVQVRFVSDGAAPGVRAVLPDPDRATVSVRPLPPDPHQRRLLAGLDLRAGLDALQATLAAEEATLDAETGVSPDPGSPRAGRRG